jgi:hypothetical protein
MTLNSTLRYRIVAIGDQYHWLDRGTGEPLTYKDGQVAQWATLDAAIAAFVEEKLTAERNEEMGQL